MVWVSTSFAGIWVTLESCKGLPPRLVEAATLFPRFRRTQAAARRTACPRPVPIRAARLYCQENATSKGLPSNLNSGDRGSKPSALRARCHERRADKVSRISRREVRDGVQVAGDAAFAGAEAREINEDFLTTLET